MKIAIAFATAYFNFLVKMECLSLKLDKIKGFPYDNPNNYKGLDTFQARSAMFRCPLFYSGQIENNFQRGPRFGT